MTGPTVVGIDAGGSTVRAAALGPAGRVAGGIGGPGNPLTVGGADLARHYAEALDGFVDVAAVAACVAGSGRPEGRERIERLLGARFPSATISVVPDYWGAFMSAPVGTDIVVIAGTGSVVCSRSAPREFPVSGGRGWILSDHGSAARLGRALLDRFALAPDLVPPAVVEAITAATGVAAPKDLLAAMSEAVSPPAFLGLASPALTEAADSGDAWSLALLRDEMAPLAETVSVHAATHIAGQQDVRVGLVGGVWASAAARNAFAESLARDLPRATVERVEASPVDGALRLAQELLP